MKASSTGRAAPHPVGDGAPGDRTRATDGAPSDGGHLAHAREGESAAGQQAIRAHNLSVVLDEIARAPGISRAEVSDASGLSKTTVSSLVAILAEAGLVAEGDHGNATGLGRPATGLRINPGGLSGIGVEVARNYISVTEIDLGGRCSFERFVPMDNVGRDPVAVLEQVCELIEGGRREVAAPNLPLAGVGVAVPGWVDHATQSVIVSKVLGWEDVSVADIIQTLLGWESVAAAVLNEANGAALGEYWYGGHPDVRDFLFVSGGMGVGAGIVLQGGLFAGAHGVAGEIGHMQVAPTGARCYCGLRGCLQQVAGEEAILQMAGLAAPPGQGSGGGDRLADLVQRAKIGDKAALRSLSVAGRAIGAAVTGLVNVLDIESVVLGGIYTSLFPWIGKAAENVVQSSIVATRFPVPKLLMSSLGRHAAGRGAAGVMMRSALGWPRPTDPSLGTAGHRGWLSQLAHVPRVPRTVRRRSQSP